MAMRDDTPYHLRPPTEVKREQACMREIFQKAPEAGYIYEAFAGMAVTAEVLRERFPRSVIVATDLDAQCVDTYNEAGYGTAFQQDALDWVKKNLPDEAHHWGVSLDYNKFTLMDLRGDPGRANWKQALLKAVIKSRPAWVQITDSACRYLHLNAVRAYGMDGPDFPAYVDKFQSHIYDLGWRYDLRAVSKHHAASYMLFVKE